MKRAFPILLLLAAAALLAPDSARACATCYGANIDSPMTQGMNWGIATLMGVIGTVLASFLVFFIYIIRRGEAMNATAELAKKSAKV